MPSGGLAGEFQGHQRHHDDMQQPKVSARGKNNGSH